MFNDKVVIQVLDEARHVVVCFAVSSGVPIANWWGRPEPELEGRSIL